MHALIYLGVALAYVEGAVENILNGNWHTACRNTVLALFYLSIAIFAFNEAFSESLGISHS